MRPLPNYFGHLFDEITVLEIILVTDRVLIENYPSRSYFMAALMKSSSVAQKRATFHIAQECSYAYDTKDWPYVVKVCIAIMPMLCIQLSSTQILTLTLNYCKRS